jgi:hypothetical protein
MDRAHKKISPQITESIHTTNTQLTSIQTVTTTAEFAIPCLPARHVLWLEPAFPLTKRKKKIKNEELRASSGMRGKSQARTEHSIAAHFELVLVHPTLFSQTPLNPYVECKAKGERVIKVKEFERQTVAYIGNQQPTSL